MTISKEEKEQILGMLTQIVNKQKEQDERFEELEKNTDGSGRAKVIVTEMAYNPDRKHLSGMTIIPMSVVEPFALATVCGSILSPEVRSGQLSLGDIYMDEVKWLLRSVKGKGFEAATEHAREEQAGKGEGIGGEPVDLGKGF